MGEQDARFPERRPRVGARFYKGHGLGNDYLVVEEVGGGAAGSGTSPEAVWTALPEAVRRVCHPHEGVGSDGIVVLLAPEGEGAGHGGSRAPFGLRMFNPDGSEFERSGNGLRILASHLHRTGRVEAGRPFRVTVGGDTLAMTVHGATEDGAFDVSLEMGRARTGPEAVALDPDAAPSLPVTLVSVGNPHCVVFPEELGDADGAGAASGEVVATHETADLDAPALDRRTLDRLGPFLAEHPAFRHGTNVQLARVESPGSSPEGAAVVRALVWERGVGHTTASGTSACAVAVAAVTSGRANPGRVEVLMEGGPLRVDVSPELDVVLRGPVREVMEGRLAPGFARSLT